MKCTNKNGKQIFIVIKHEKVNTKGIEQGFALVLNKLNIMGVLSLFIPF
jgi:hypothetical protein